VAARRRRRSCADEGLLERGNHSIRSEFRGPNSAGESATHRRGCACAATSRHERGRALHALRDEPEQGLLLHERLVRLIGVIMTFVESCPSGSRMGSVTEFGVGLNGAAADWPAECVHMAADPGRATQVSYSAWAGGGYSTVRLSRPSHWAKPRGCKLSTRIAYVLARGGRGRLLDVFTAVGPSRPAQRAAFGSSRPLAAAPSGGTFACERGHGAAGAHSKRGAHTRRARLASTTPQDTARSPSIADGQEQQPTSE
jgi:hypothetical protein